MTEQGIATGGRAILTSMDDSQGTKSRWFRFRLSTVLILTAIVAWGMVTRPSIRCGGDQLFTSNRGNGLSLGVEADSLSQLIED